MRRTQKASRRASTTMEHEISKMGEELADLAAAIGRIGVGADQGELSPPCISGSIA